MGVGFRMGAEVAVSDSSLLIIEPTFILLE